MQLDDNLAGGYKIFRDVDTLVPLDLRSCKHGFTVTGQDSITDLYTVAKPGDEAGWVFLEPDTREMGSYAQAVPAMLLSTGGVVPILDKTQATDSSYAALTTGTTANSTSVCRVAEASGGDTPGILVQCLNQDKYEYLFFPVGGNLLVADNVNIPSNDYSSIIYEALAGGGADTSKYGSFQELFIIDHPYPYLKTDARFRYDTSKKGPLAFNSGATPAASLGETLYQPTLHFNATSGKWEWYVVVTDGTGLVADNTNAVDSSSKIYGAQVGGGADVGNAGSLKSVFYIESNFPYIGTTTQYRQDSVKKGALAFQSTAAPSASAGQTLFQPTLHFNATSGKWEWYLVLDDQSSSVYCRVAWNYTEAADRTVAEVMSLSGTTFTATNTQIWIDTKLSAAVQHETAGTDTIFQATLVQASYSRFGISRDLYRLTLCVKDEGKKITHFQKTGRGINLLEGYYLSTDLSASPIADPSGSRILTRIAGSDVSNIHSVRVPSEWNTASQDWSFLQIFDVSRSLPYYFSPIDPLMWDLDTKVYKSEQGEFYYAKI